GQGAAEGLGLAQFGFVVAGSGQWDIEGNGAFGQFAQSRRGQVQAEAEVAREGGVAVDQQFGAGAGAVGRGGGDQGTAACVVESGQAGLDAADAGGQRALQGAEPGRVVGGRGRWR